MEAREGELKNLETWLGDDHNLVVLREKLEGNPDQYGGDQNVHLFVTVMDKYSEELREQALSLGTKIYEQKPKLLIREMQKLWDAWQNEPPARKSPGSLTGTSKQSRAVA